jgi:hypothetical protein
LKKKKARRAFRLPSYGARHARVLENASRHWTVIAAAYLIRCHFRRVGDPVNIGPSLATYVRDWQVQKVVTKSKLAEAATA